MRTAGVCLLLAALGATPISAQMRVDGLSREAPPKILIFTVRGAGVSTPYVRFQESVRAEIEAHMFVRVISMDETFAPGGVAHTKLENCRGDPACLAGLVGKFDARYLLVVTASFLGEAALLGSRLIDLSSLKVLGEAVDEVPGARPDFLTVLPARVRASVPAELWDPFGSLLIKAEPPGSRLSINGRVVGTAPLAKLGYLLPGDYKIEAHKDGFLPAQSTAHITRTAESVVTLNLAPIEVESGSGWVVWVVVSAVAVAGAATAAVLLVGGERDPRFCSSPDPGACPR